MRYDPDLPIDREAWLATDESARIDAVLDYHEKRGIEIPGPNSHASLHVVVENQVAVGGELPAEATLERLIAEGLSRHDAIHALATVISRHMFEMLKEKKSFDSAAYNRELETLTAKTWLATPKE